MNKQISFKNQATGDEYKVLMDWNNPSGYNPGEPGFWTIRVLKNGKSVYFSTSQGYESADLICDFIKNAAAGKIEIIGESDDGN